VSRAARSGAVAWGLGAAAATFTIVNAFNALHKGGDFTVYLDAGRRLLSGSPLYEGSGIAGGVIGPPFQAALVAPFAALALVSIDAARLAWYALNLACLAAGVYWWHAALERHYPSHAPGPAAVVWPLLAVAYPLQTNFEHQNINCVLLALTGLAARREAQDRGAEAGWWLGTAAALKAFPLLLFGVAAVRSRWRMLAWAAASAVGLTLLPVLRYGADGYARLLTDWWTISGSGHWPIRRANQSLFAMLGRFLEPGELLTWGPIPDTASPEVHLLWAATAAAAAIGFLVLVWRWRRAGTPVAFAAALCLAVVLSPIAWEHYWLLLWPAFAICYRPPAGSPRWVPWVFWIAAALTSAITPGTVGRAGVALARSLSLRTWAALLLCAAVLAVYRSIRHAEAQRLSCVHHEHGHPA
jgi:alpha-1,2-mannosyltransferase